MVKTVLVGLVTLTLIGPAYAAAPDKAPESTIVGTYACEGTNPDGGTYSGIVQIIKHHDAYLVRWTMPDDTQVVPPFQTTQLQRNGYDRARLTVAQPGAARPLSS